MVVEFLTFSIPASDLDEWLAMEARHWTGFLREQDGFVRKEVWRRRDDPTQVEVVVWWDSWEQWQSIPDAALAEVAAAMGPFERQATCVAFDIV